MNQNYKAGDIVIFKAGNEWLSKCVTWLTDSDVSHAAMIYSQDSIVEIGANGVGLHKMQAKKGDMAYLLRLQSQPVPEPLTERADYYIKNKNSYDFPALLYLGGLLLYRKFQPSGKLYRIIGKILTAACYELDQLIQRLFYREPGGSMVCSQFIFQLFRDCGQNYEILLAGDNAAAQEDGIRLSGLINVNTIAAGAFLPQPPSQTTQEMAEELYLALSDPAPVEDSLDVSDIEQLLAPAQYFIRRMEELLRKLNQELPVEALFVTPADMLYHSVNLERIGMLDIKRFP